MDEKPDQIIDHIEAKRDELGRNLSELEDKVRRTADWHTHFDKNPMLLLGAALGGGLLLGSMVGGRRSKSHTRGIVPWKADSGGKSGSSHSSSQYTPASVPESTPSSFAGLAGSSSSGKSSRGMTSGQMRQVGEALDHIKGALVAFGIAKTKEFLSHAVPGLENHLGDFSTGNGSKKREDQAKPYSTGSSADYRSGSQSYAGGSADNPTTGNSGRADEAEEYAGVGRTGGGTPTPQSRP